MKGSWLKPKPRLNDSALKRKKRKRSSKLHELKKSALLPRRQKPKDYALKKKRKKKRPDKRLRKLKPSD